MTSKPESTQGATITKSDLTRMAVNPGALGMEYSWNYPEADEHSVLHDAHAAAQEDLP